VNALRWSQPSPFNDHYEDDSSDNLGFSIFDDNEKNLALSIFDDKEDMHEGEVQYLMTALKKAGLSPDEYQNLYMETGILYNMTGHMKTLHALAIKEELALGNDYGRGKISDFGNAIPKYPRSWVNAILKMNDTKKYRYMFSGSVTKGKVLKHRKWLTLWVKEHFSDEDYFRATDASANSHKPWGSYDYTKADTRGFRPKDCGGSCMQLDETYYSQMLQSKFILTPGGDAPYSFRFHEAFLSGSIPIINSIDGDYMPRHSTKWVTMVQYDFKMTSDFPHTFDPAVAKRNQKKFIRYQTFLEGDNDPVRDQKDGIYQKLFG